MENVSKIALVDDNMTSLTIARDMLKTYYKVYPSPSAAKFFELIENVTPDLILMDVDMPQMNGYEAVKILKEDERFKDIPVIFLTAKTDEESELKGFELGAVDYITKPFHPSIIKARITTHLTIVEQRRIIERISLTDTLTKIPNRRNFDTQLEGEWKRAIREDIPIGMIMIDADHFKSFNDNYGHQQGDVALQTLAHVISTSIRRGADFAARWGGEEFIALLPNTDSKGAMTIAEKMREAVEQIEIKTATGEITKITISLGVYTQIPSVDTDTSVFLGNADKALYNAKSDGRNRVIKYE